MGFAKSLGENLVTKRRRNRNEKTPPPVKSVPVHQNCSAKVTKVQTEESFEVWGLGYRV